MTNSKLSKTPSFPLTSTPIYPPEPPNPTTTAACNSKRTTLTQALCPHLCTLSSSTKAHTHAHAHPLLYTLLILILISTPFRLVQSLPNFSSNKVHPSKVTTIVTPTSLRSRRQFSTIASIPTTAAPAEVSVSVSGIQTETAATSTLASPSSFSLPLCNFTEYPHSGCSPIFKATCDRQSNSCICGTESNDAENPQSSSRTSKFKTSRHRKRFCLNDAKLGNICQSSGQCRATDANSGCFSTSGDFTNWKCSCISGYVEHLGVCLPDPKLASTENAYNRCTAMGLVYISILDRCVESSQLPYYSHRSAGRAGGGRGGGGGRGRGGVGGRATGSRSWYTSDRNLMRRGSGASRPNFCLSIVITLIYIVFSSF